MLVVLVVLVVLVLVLLVVLVVLIVPVALVVVLVFKGFKPAFKSLLSRSRNSLPARSCKLLQASAACTFPGHINAGAGVWVGRIKDNVGPKNCSCKKCSSAHSFIA